MVRWTKRLSVAMATLSLTTSAEAAQAASLPADCSTYARCRDQTRSDVWLPAPEQVSRLEAQVARQVKGAPLKKRVRFYTGTHLKGRKVVLGTLWSRPQISVISVRPSDQAAMVPHPVNIVKYDDWPSILLERPLPKCGLIKVVYDVEADRVDDLRCG